MTPHFRAKVHTVRKALEIDLKPFNEWMNERYLKPLTQMPNSAVEMIVNAMKEKFGAGPAGMDPDVTIETQVMEPTHDPSVDEAFDDVRDKPIADMPQAGDADEPDEEKDDDWRKPTTFTEMKRSQNAPILGFYLADYRGAIKMLPFIEHMQKRHPDIVIVYQFGFKVVSEAQDRVRGACIHKGYYDNKGIQPMFKSGQSRYGACDLLVTTDPADKQNKRVPAKVRIGVQVNPLLFPHALAATVKKLAKYYVWNKGVKQEMRRVGVPGGKIQAIGSPWLAYIKDLAGHHNKSHTALLYAPDTTQVPVRAYWTSSGIAPVLHSMGMEIHVIRFCENPIWLPKIGKSRIKVVCDAVTPLARRWNPKVAVAAPGTPCEEAAVMGVPILRLKVGQIATTGFVKQAKVEAPEKGTGDPLSFWRLRNAIGEILGFPCKYSEETFG